MSNIQPALPPVATTTPPSSSGGNGKGEIGAAADFLSLVVDAAGEDAPPAEGEGIAGPLVEETKETVADSTEGLIAIGAIPTLLPEIAPVAPTFDANLLAEATPLVGEAAVSNDALEQALTQAGKAKGLQDVLLAAQATAAAPDEAVDAALDPQSALAAAKLNDDKTSKDQPASLPGSSLSMTETAETAADALPAALAFRKALDNRATSSERVTEAATDAPRSENASARADARPIADPNAIVRIAAANEAAPFQDEEVPLSSLLDSTAKLSTGDEKLDALLGGKTGDAKSTSFSSALAMVKGVAVNPQAVVAQVAVQLTAAGKAKNQAMTVKLEPVELGKIDIRLDFGADGKVQAAIFADRPQTLDMLQKDARGLEKALQNAGLQTDSGSLSFNLRGQDREQTANGDGRKFSTEDAGDDSLFGGETITLVAGNTRGPAVGRIDMLL